MHKDFIYIPSRKVWLNVNHIVEIRLISNSKPNDMIRVILSNAIEDPEGDTVCSLFDITDLKHFEKVIGVIENGQ